MASYNVEINKYVEGTNSYDQLYPKAMNHASTHGVGGSDPVTPSSIGAANEIHNHNASQIVGGTLPISRGGTGANSVEGIKQALGIPGLKIVMGSTSIAGSRNSEFHISFDSNNRPRAIFMKRTENSTFIFSNASRFTLDDVLFDVTWDDRVGDFLASSDTLGARGTVNYILIY